MEELGEVQTEKQHLLAFFSVVTPALGLSSNTS
jgi:hypothetical protein